MSAPLSAGFAHSTLDVAAFPTAIDTPRSHSLQLRNTELFSLVDGEDLAIHGHILREDESLERTLIYGRFIGRDGARGFVRTDDTCEMGMCGGPVLDSNDNVVGILEGVVPNLQENESAKSDMHKNIAGSGAFIGAQEINLFLNDVHKSLLGTAPKTEEKA